MGPAARWVRILALVVTATGCAAFPATHALPLGGRLCRGATPAFLHTRALPSRSAVGLHMSLYADQERVIVSRGELEAQLMPPPIPLEAAKRGSSAGAGGGGFGAVASSKQGLSKQYLAEAKVLAKELKREGVVRIDNVLSDETADALKAYIQELRKQSTEDVESGRVASLQRRVDTLRVRKLESTCENSDELSAPRLGDVWYPRC